MRKPGGFPVLLFLTSVVLMITVTACEALESSADVSEVTTTADISTTTVIMTTTTTVVRTAPPTHWTKLNPKGEPSRGGSMVYDPKTDTDLHFANDGGVWAYDSDTNDWSEAGGAFPGGSQPFYRYQNGRPYYDSRTEQILLIGSGDVWSYDSVGGTWTDLSPTGAAPSGSGYAVAYDLESGKAFLFGGVEPDEENQRTGETWVYDSIANQWNQLEPTGDIPTARRKAAMAYDPQSGNVILHGGYGGGEEIKEVKGDTWAYDPSLNTWTQTSPSGTLGARADAEMVYHPGCGMLILFGGRSNLDSSGELYPETLWAYDSAANTWTELDPAGRFPYGREDHAMVYESKSGKIVMFGGTNEILEIDEGTEFLHGTWTLTP
jgi:N-acetylneuraminic acid mutarotase